MRIWVPHYSYCLAQFNWIPSANLKIKWFAFTSKVPLSWTNRNAQHITEPIFLNPPEILVLGFISINWNHRPIYLSKCTHRKPFHAALRVCSDCTEAQKTSEYIFNTRHNSESIQSDTSIICKERPVHKLLIWKIPVALRHITKSLQ